jgi:hypothetical protein
MLCSSSHLLNLGPQATPDCEDGGSGGVVSVKVVRQMRPNEFSKISPPLYSCLKHLTTRR